MWTSRSLQDRCLPSLLVANATTLDGADLSAFSVLSGIVYLSLHAWLQQRTFHSAGSCLLLYASVDSDTELLYDLKLGCHSNARAWWVQKAMGMPGSVKEEV